MSGRPTTLLPLLCVTGVLLATAIRPLALAPQADSVSTNASNATVPAKYGSSAVTATATVYQVSSVSASKSEIAAGALASAPHQTEIRIQVSPPGAVPVAVWLTGGRGHAVGAPQTYAGHQLIIEGPARIEGGGNSFVAGGTTPSRAAILVTTDANGKAVLTLTSSNQAGQTCTVHAKSGTDSTLTGSQKSCEVVSGKGSQTVSFPDYFALGATVTATVTRTFNGVPLAGHDTVIYVAAVRVGGKLKKFAWMNPMALNVYAEIAAGDVRKDTDAAGQASAPVMIKGVADLESVTIESRDFQVFER